MSIKLKLVAGCICLTIITIVVGLFSQFAQQKIGTLAVQIYDDALLSTSALRSAQSSMIRLDADLRLDEARAHDGPPRGAIDDDRTRTLRSAIGGILADLTTAGEGSISSEGREATLSVRSSLATIRAAGARITERMLIQKFGMVNAQLDAAVRIFQSDAYGVRRDVGILVEETVSRTWIAMSVALAIGAIMAIVLSRAIVPALRQAMSITKSIAEGKFDNEITPKGGREAAELFAALAEMQGSISRHCGRIECDAADQADAYASRIDVQGARFQAALDNMTQGLCMFDAGQILVVVNRRFAEMFGEVEIGQSFRALAAMPRLRAVLKHGRDPYSTHCGDDGRMIAVSRQAIGDGGLVMTFEDVTERHQSAERISHMATHDGLTGLPNRAEFHDGLDRAIAGGGGWKGKAILALDLRGFKFVNDTLGHAVGDELLKTVSERVVSLIEPHDLVARIGGDEFAIVLTDTVQPRAVEALARRLIELVGQPMDLLHQRVSIGLSIGIVAALAKGGRASGDTADSLIKKADLALVAAKAAGRNGYRFFEPEMAETIEQRRRTELDLAQALEREEFELFFQPFVNVAQRRVTGFEALLRWNHPQRGSVSPAEFVPVAEEMGLIEPIGIWVLDSACRQAAGWPDDLSVSVNLSPAQFRSVTLYDDVLRTLKRTGLAPSRLQLEITESVLLNDTESVLKILTAFRALGIRISMDDFGTGYSSLGYLSRFPFDKVKIDQSFVRDLAKRENIAVVRAVIGLSKAMGIAVIAEGVETENQLATLLGEGCEEMQGFHFSRPRPVAELPHFLMRFALGLPGDARTPAARTRGTANATTSRIPSIQGL